MKGCGIFGQGVWNVPRGAESVVYNERLSEGTDIHVIEIAWGTIDHQHSRAHMAEKNGGAHVEQRHNFLSSRKIQHFWLYTVFDVQPPKGKDVDWTLKTNIEHRLWVQGWGTDQA